MPKENGTTDVIAKLSIPDRLAMIRQLWNSIGAESDGPSLSLDQTAEIERRLADLDSGRMETLPWQEVQELLGWGT